MLPNFIFIGPDKTGSTWLAGALAAHPQIYVTPAKDIYFFDRYWDKGLEWYERQFRGATNETVVAEVCHDYLFSSEAAGRIASAIPNVRLMVCLRRPGERAFSAYLQYIRHGYYEGTFEEALEDLDELIDHGRYATHLGPYVELFGIPRIHVALFDDLRASSQTFIDGVTGWLGLDPAKLAEELLKPKLAAAAPRSASLARLSRSIGVRVRDGGFGSVLGRVKSSRLVGNTLYRTYKAGEQPVADAEVLAAIDSQLAPEIRALSSLVGMDIAGRWGLA